MGSNLVKNRGRAKKIVNRYHEGTKNLLLMAEQLASAFHGKEYEEKIDAHGLTGFLHLASYMRAFFEVHKKQS